MMRPQRVCFGTHASGRIVHLVYDKRIHHTLPKPRQGDDDDEEDGGHGGGAADFSDSLEGDLREGAAAAAHGGDEDEEILARPAEADADDDPDQAGEITELCREDRADQRARAADGGEVVAEEDPFAGRVVVLAV